MKGPSRFRLYDRARSELVREMAGDYPESGIVNKAYSTLGSLAVSVHNSGDAEVMLLVAARMVELGRALIDQVIAEDGGYRPAPRRPKKHAAEPTDSDAVASIEAPL